MGHPRLNIESTWGRSKTSRKTSTVRCRDYSSPGVQGNGTTKHLRSKWNGVGMLLNWLLLICVMGFWWFLNIVNVIHLQGLFAEFVCIDYVLIWSTFPFSWCMAWWFQVILMKPSRADDINKTSYEQNLTTTMSHVRCFFWQSQELQDPF